MKGLQSSDPVLRLSSEPLGDAHIEMLAVVLGNRAKLERYLLLAKGVVLKLLGRLGRVYMGCEDVVQVKLTGEHVHHDATGTVGNPGRLGLVGSILGRLWVFAGGAEREPIQCVFASEHIGRRMAI